MTTTIHCWMFRCQRVGTIDNTRRNPHGGRRDASNWSRQENCPLCNGPSGRLRAGTIWLRERHSLQPKFRPHFLRSGESTRTHVRWAAGGHVSPTGANLRSQKVLFFAQKSRGIGKSQNNNNTSSLSLSSGISHSKCCQSSCAMLGHYFVRQISFEHSFKQIDKNQKRSKGLISVVTCICIK